MSGLVEFLAVRRLERALREVNPAKLQEASLRLAGTRNLRATGALLHAFSALDPAIGEAVEHALDVIDHDWHNTGCALNAVPSLIAALEGRDWERREKRLHAVRVLGRIRDSRAVGPLVCCLAKYGISSEARRALDQVDPNWPRSEAARQAVPDLIAALTRGISSEADRALNEIDANWPRSEAARQAVPDLIRALEDRDTDTSSHALKTLGRIGDSRAVGPLLRGLARAPRDAEAALDQVDPNWPETEAARQAVPDLIAALVQGSWYYPACRLAAALERIEPKWRENKNVERLADELFARLSDKPLEPSTAWVLGWIGGPFIVSRLYKNINACAPERRSSLVCASAAALAYMGDPYGEELLIHEFLELRKEDPDRSFIDPVIEHLRNIGTEKCRAELLKVLRRGGRFGRLVSEHLGSVSWKDDVILCPECDRYLGVRRELLAKSARPPTSRADTVIIAEGVYSCPGCRAEVLI